MRFFTLIMWCIVAILFIYMMIFGPAYIHRNAELCREKGGFSYEPSGLYGPRICWSKDGNRIFLK